MTERSPSTLKLRFSTQTTVHTVTATATLAPEADAASSAIDSGAAAALRMLGMTLARAGYGEIHPNFNPLTPMHADWMGRDDAIPPRLRATANLFLRSQRVDVAALPSDLRELVGPLADIGVLQFHGEDQLSMGNLVLLPVAGCTEGGYF